MSYIIINGSPRKNMNSAKLLETAIKELNINGKETTLYHLYDLNFKGCYSCFACKKVDKSSYGECIVKDDLQEVFTQIDKSEGFILASPIYFQDVTGEMRSFLERLLFRKFVYTNPPKSLVEKPKKVGFIYTMNVDEERHNQSSQKAQLENMEQKLNFIYKNINSYYSFSTNQLNSYKGIEYSYFDSEARLKNHEENFPKELENIKQFVRNIISN